MIVDFPLPQEPIRPIILDLTDEVMTCANADATRSCDPKKSTLAASSFRKFGICEADVASSIWWTIVVAFRPIIETFW
jgi:hypothetical protein